METYSRKSLFKEKKKTSPLGHFPSDTDTDTNIIYSRSIKHRTEELLHPTYITLYAFNGNHR